MRVIQKKVKDLERYQYYLKHLSIINQVLPIQLSNKELEVLAAFMQYEGDLVKDDRFNSTVRKNVMKQLSLSSGGLSNHLRALINKGFLEKGEFTSLIKVKSFLFPEEDSQGYQILIIKKRDAE